MVIRWRRTRQNGFGKKCCAPNDKMENHLLPAKSTRFLCNSYCLLCVETKHFFYRFSLLYLYYIRIYFTIIYLFFFFSLSFILTVMFVNYIASKLYENNFSYSPILRSFSGNAEIFFQFFQTSRRCYTWRPIFVQLRINCNYCCYVLVIIG